MTTRANTAAKRRIFALAYAKEPNARKAAEAAGYKYRPDYAATLLATPDVRAILDDQARRATAATGVDVASVVRDLDELRQVDIGDVFEDDGEGNPKLRDWSTITKTARRAIAKIKVTKKVFTRTTRDGETETDTTITTEVALVDRLEVLQKLGNHLGAFRKDDQPSTDAGVRYVVVVPDPMKTVEEWSRQLPR